MCFYYIITMVATEIDRNEQNMMFLLLLLLHCWEESLQVSFSLYCISCAYDKTNIDLIWDAIREQRGWRKQTFQELTVPCSDY